MNTILITGTSTGLGKTLVQYFAERGWNVIATSRNPKNLFSKYKNVKELELNITDWDSLHNSVITDEKLWENIDVVVNNAGMAIVGALEDTDTKNIKEVFDVNILGTINVIKSILPFFKKRGRGKIINISSLIGLSVDIPLTSVYAMSKFALEGLSEGLYFELKAQNIDLHLVEPGGFKSSLIQNAIISAPNKNTVYEDIYKRLNSVLETKSKDENAPHTEISDVVNTVYQLAANEKKGFRNPVGSDSSEILKTRKENSIDEYLSLIGKNFL